MSKNSFTKNFNSCVAGFPIASVAAHMVLHEGLGKDLLKVGVPAAILAGLYNYGDDMAQGISDWGAKHQDMNVGGWNIGQAAQNVGNKLNDWHTAGTHWAQDSFLGKAAGLGGQEAIGRQAYEKSLADAQTNITKSYNDDITNLTKQRDDGQISYDEWNKKVAEAGQLRDQRLGHAQVNAAQYMRDQMSEKKLNPNAYNPQMMKFSDGKMTNNPYQPQPPIKSEQFGPPRPTPIQATASAISAQAGSQQIAASLPNATKTAISGATAGAAAGSAFTPKTSNSVNSSVPNPFGQLPTVGGVNGKSYSLVKPEIPAEQPQTGQNQQVQQPMQAGGSKVPEPQKEPSAPPANQTLRVPPSAPQPEKKLQFDYNKYNQQAMAIPAGSEFGLTAPEATSNAQQQPQQLPQARVSVGDNIYQNPTLQQRELVKPNIPLQQQQQPAQPAPRMQLNATPQAAQRLLGNQPSMATGTDTNLNNTQDPVFNGKRRQFLNGANFDTQNKLKTTTLGGSFTPNQNQPRQSPFGSRK